MISKSRYCALMIFLFIIAASAKSQGITQSSCNDSLVIRQADSIKKYYHTLGFSLLREACLNMESEYEFPVIVPLNKGTWYQFVFIGEYSSRLFEVRMYDWNEKMVIFRQHKWADIDGNIISYAYVPRFSEFHMIKPVQVNKHKKKNLNGYIMMFKRTDGKLPKESDQISG
ncbi:MAG: hypothetical protein N2747_04905 [Chitinophagaceae bacterium]|nr:hypothetical protein [Chitinophagaceae bacterium]